METVFFVAYFKKALWVISKFKFFFEFLITSLHPLCGKEDIKGFYKRHLTPKHIAGKEREAYEKWILKNLPFDSVKEKTPPVLAPN